MSSDDSDEYSFSDDSVYYKENSSDHVILQMQKERYKVFKEQDEEKGHFDCTLEIGEKKLYCHKFVLACASETFNALLSNRWNNNKDGVIKIENPEYTYECFYEFISFLYSGECDINDENIYVLTDMAEYYGVQHLKKRCEKFVYGMNITVENVQEMFDFIDKYSLEGCFFNIDDFINEEFEDIIKAPQFLQYKKPFLEFMARAIMYPKYLAFFDSVYEWGHHQATNKKAESKDEDFDIYACMKADLDEILSDFVSSQMDFDFVIKSILPKRFLFSVIDLYGIIANCKRNDDQEHECFKTLCQVAENEIKKRNPTAIYGSFDMNEDVKIELDNFLKDFRFTVMPIEFLMDFVVEKGFDFSLVNVHNFLKNISEAHAFKAVYKLAEKQVLIQQQKSPNQGFNLINAVKIRLHEVFVNVKYHLMSIDFLMNFVENQRFLERRNDSALVKNGLFLSPSDFRIYLDNVSLSQMDAFKAVYRLAEKQVLMKQKLTFDFNIDLSESVKAELAYVIPKLKFYEMDIDFINDFVVANGIISKEAADHIFDVCVEIKNDGMSICGSFKDDYGLMKKISSNNCGCKPQSWNKKTFCSIKIKIPKTPSTVQKMKGVEWYLCIKKSGILAAKHQTIIKRTDYLIAEMRPNFNGEFMFNNDARAKLSAHYKNI